MKIVLINPPQDHALPSESGGGPGNTYPPLGLLYLQAALENRKLADVSVVDAAMPGRFDAFLSGEAPDLVGLTAMTPNLVSVVRAIERIRNSFPGAKIVLGGAHTSIYPEESAGLPGVDFVLPGEAEETLSELAAQLSAGVSLPPIPEFALERDYSGCVSPPHAADLDSLAPPDRSRLGSVAYRGLAGSDDPFATMITSRGCPHRCTFCSTPREKYRFRSVESILAEVEQVRELPVKHLYFLDDNFPVKGKRLGALCDGLAKHRDRFSWSCRTAVAGLTEDSLRQMKAAGCIRVQVGAETATDDGLEVLGKSATVEQVRTALDAGGRVGLEAMAYYMIGLPNETTAAEVERTIRFAVSNPASYAMFNVLTLYPGTRLYEDAMKAGLVKSDVWRAFATNPDLGFVPPVWDEHLSREELFTLLRKAYRRFYWRPSVLIRQLRTAGGLRGILRKLGVGLRMLIPSGKAAL
jgi:radical SAM superfamily enzyme YgiQ (UPF0313 family)